MICNNCGKEINDNSVFCPECGLKVAAPTPQPAVNDEPAKEEAVFTEQSAEPEAGIEKHFEPAEVPAPPAQAGFTPSAGMPPQPPVNREPYSYANQNYQPAPTPVPYPPQPAAMPAERAVSTGMYVLMLIVGSIPLIGLIVHIIALTTSKNKGFKNYCRAYVILGIIGFIIALAIAVVGYFMFDKIQDFLRDFNIDVEKMF